MGHTIHSFRELTDLYQKRLGLRYDEAEVARASQGEVECDDQVADVDVDVDVSANATGPAPMASTAAATPISRVAGPAAVSAITIAVFAATSAKLISQIDRKSTRL